MTQALSDAYLYASRYEYLNEVQLNSMRLVCCGLLPLQ